MHHSDEITDCQTRQARGPHHCDLLPGLYSRHSPLGTLRLAQAPYHLTQLIAIILCLVSSIVFLTTTRSSPFGPWQWLASSALALCSLWLAFVAYVLLTYSGPEG